VEAESVLRALPNALLKKKPANRSFVRIHKFICQIFPTTLCYFQLLKVFHFRGSKETKLQFRKILTLTFCSSICLTPTLSSFNVILKYSIPIKTNVIGDVPSPTVVACKLYYLLKYYWKIQFLIKTQYILCQYIYIITVISIFNHFSSFFGDKLKNMILQLHFTHFWGPAQMSLRV
jgi:hypothetical protein